MTFCYDRPSRPVQDSANGIFIPFQPVNEIEQFRIESNVRFVLMRWLYLVLGIGFSALIIYLQSQTSSALAITTQTAKAVGPLMIVFFAAALFNFLFLFICQYIENKQSVLLGRLVSGLQIMSDLTLTGLVVIFLYPEFTWSALLFLIPLTEAIVLFDFLVPIGVGLISGVILASVRLGGLYLPGDPTLIGQELAYGASYLLMALVLSHNYQLIKPFNIFAVQKKVAKQNLAHDEQLQWVRKYGQKMEENNRKLYAKELELKLAKQELSALDEAKSKFISVTAHQMRTPLSGIKWTFNMLMSGQLGPVNEEQKKFIAQGSEGAEKMITIINSLLHVDNIETKWSDIKLNEMNVDALLDNVLVEFSNQLTSKKINFKLEKPNNVLPSIEADPGKIRMVLENLIDNAIKYTPENGTITVKVDDQKINTASHSVEIIVKDSGIGIPSSEQSKIFQKFFRASNAVATEPDGSGVGLYIAKDIIEGHHGTLWFESTAGQGTEFHFTLPIRQPQTAGV